MENYQTPEGVKVPEVLQPFMGGLEFLPYNEKKVKAFKDKLEKEDKLAEEKAAKKNKGGKTKEVPATVKPEPLIPAAEVKPEEEKN
jgi:hypothetical protein